MISKLISIFKKVEEDNNTYAQEFIDFYKKCVETFPRTLKNELRNVQIKPCVKTTAQSIADEYTMTFTWADIMWWQGMIENEPLYFKKPDELKREVIHAALDIFDGLQISDEKYNEYTKDLMKELEGLNNQ